MGFSPTVHLVPYAAEAPPFPSRPHGWLMHVQAGLNSPWQYFADLKAPNRAFSHYWIAKTGAAEQYQDPLRQSWAQSAGNPLYWSVEFEGFPLEPVTAAQIITAAQLHNLMKVADIVTDTPGAAGVGTHAMGGPAYGHPSCPGPLRAAQRQEIINLARHLRNAPPAPAPAKPLKALQVRLIQGAVHVTVDGLLGVQTLNAANGVIRKDTSNTKWLQARVGTTVDGRWGRRSDLAWILAVQRIQSALGVTADGRWGPLSAAAWAALLRQQA